MAASEVDVSQTHEAVGDFLRTRPVGIEFSKRPVVIDGERLDDAGKGSERYGGVVG